MTCMNAISRTHLVDTATGFTNVASKQLNVVDLTGARGSLVTLVDTLKGRGEYCLAGPDDLDCLPQEFRGNTSDLVHPLRGVALDDTLQLFDPDRVLLDILLVDVSSLEHFPLHTVEQGQVGSCSGLQVYRGEVGRRSPSRVDDDASRRIGSVQTIKHTGPEDGLSGGDVVSDDEETIGHVDIGVRPGLTVTAERLSLDNVTGQFYQRRKYESGPSPNIPWQSQRSRYTVECSHP